MKVEFTKMHGCGNDYIYINGEKYPEDGLRTPVIINVLSDRHMGIGSDGVIFINNSDIADFEMEMYNADGSRSEMCGNGIRCVAKYVYDKGLMPAENKSVDIESFGKIKHIKLFTEGREAVSARVDMGEPVLDAGSVPVDISLYGVSEKTDKEAVIDFPIEAYGQTYNVTCVSMGNPHAVIYVDDPDDIDIEKIGPALENHAFFPKRANIEFVTNNDRKHVKMRVWERGTGETMACGTGCCAVTVAGVLNGFIDRDSECEIQVRGGSIYVNYSSDGHVYMTGPATTVYEGTVEVDLA